jgi:hypothetical protein
VAVGGNRVENMTVEQIAHAFYAGQLNVRTPLWPPGTTGWQALGNFEQFQMQQPQYAAANNLAQFEEADDDPTRMWTGGTDELPGLEAYGLPEPPPLEPRPSARTGTRQVVQPRPTPAQSQPAPMAQTMASRPAPNASLPPSRNSAVAHSSIPPFRKSRGNGLMLVAGLVGLVGLGSAVLAARGSWGSSDAAAETAAEAAAPATEAPAAEPAAPAAAEAIAEAKPASGEAQLAKYDDNSASAFVAGERKPTANEAKVPASAEAAGDQDAKAEKAAAAKDESDKPDDAPARSERPSRSAKAHDDDAPTKKVSSRATPRRAALSKSKVAALPRAEKPEKADKVEKVEKVEAAEAAPEPKQAPANASVNEAAASALANSANLAASCRPRGGPAGAGKARVIYSNDGEVQSVEILTAKFRDTLTGSCVRMVFRRAKIPAFKGEPPTFIKSFTIPEE